jgi:peptidoglycan hydrolase-like amidase
VTKYVKLTKWKVISYEWKLIKAWYFSSSDGTTRSYKEYCESNTSPKICEDIPYLQSMDDPAWVWKIRSGHGVGISGIGATYAASLGKKYGEIIAYYMSGASIMSINQLK